MKFHKKANKRNLAVLAALGLVIAGGAAFTTTIDTTSQAATALGFGQVTTTNAALVSIVWVWDGVDLPGGTPVEPDVNAVTIVTAGDTHLSDAYFGFNAGGVFTTVGCSGTFGTTTTTYLDCDLSTSTLGLAGPITVASIQSTEIVLATSDPNVG